MGMGVICNMQGWCCRGHKKSQEQKLKERYKSNFQTRNEIKSCDSKKKHKNYKQEHEMCKRNVKMDIYYANMNMKIT